MYIVYSIHIYTCIWVHIHFIDNNRDDRNTGAFICAWEKKIIKLIIYFFMERKKMLKIDSFVYIIYSTILFKDSNHFDGNIYLFMDILNNYSEERSDEFFIYFIQSSFVNFIQLFLVMFFILGIGNMF